MQSTYYSTLVQEERLKLINLTCKEKMKKWIVKRTSCSGWMAILGKVHFTQDLASFSLRKSTALRRKNILSYTPEKSCLQRLLNESFHSSGESMLISAASFETISIGFKGYLIHFPAQTRKKKKKRILLKKNSLCFWEMELSTASIKKRLIFSYISGNRIPKNLFIFHKM